MTTNPCGCFEQAGRCYCEFLIEEFDRNWRALLVAFEGRLQVASIGMAHEDPIVKSIRMSQAIIDTCARVTAIVTEDRPTQRRAT